MRQHAPIKITFIRGRMWVEIGRGPTPTPEEIRFAIDKAVNSRFNAAHHD